MSPAIICVVIVCIYVFAAALVAAYCDYMCSIIIVLYLSYAVFRDTHTGVSASIRHIKDAVYVNHILYPAAGWLSSARFAGLYSTININFNPWFRLRDAGGRNRVVAY